MAQSDPEKYTLDDEGQITEVVGSWAIEKLKLVTNYVHASGGARTKYQVTGAAYIDPFCGPGRSQVRGKQDYIDGSPVAAYKSALRSPGKFSSICIADGNDELRQASIRRLIALGAPVQDFSGTASEAIPKIVKSLNPNGLHLAFLDPYNLGNLSFDLFVELAKLKHVDVIAHVSLSDLRRNADRYSHVDFDQFDKFAPGWRDHVNTNSNMRSFRSEILKFWSSRIKALGLPQARHEELIRGDQGQPVQEQ